MAKPLPFQPSSATLPEDVLSYVPAPSERPDIASASAQTEVQNRVAAQSTLRDADLDALLADKPSAREEIAREPEVSIAVQTGKLPPKILDLLAE